MKAPWNRPRTASLCPCCGRLEGLSFWDRHPCLSGVAGACIALVAIGCAFGLAVVALGMIFKFGEMLLS